MRPGPWPAGVDGQPWHHQERSHPLELPPAQVSGCALTPPDRPQPGGGTLHSKVCAPEDRPSRGTHLISRSGAEAVHVDVAVSTLYMAGTRGASTSTDVQRKWEESSSSAS